MALSRASHQTPKGEQAFQKALSLPSPPQGPRAGHLRPGVGRLDFTEGSLLSLHRAFSFNGLVGLLFGRVPKGIADAPILTCA